MLLCMDMVRDSVLLAAGLQARYVETNEAACIFDCTMLMMLDCYAL